MSFERLSRTVRPLALSTAALLACGMFMPDHAKAATVDIFLIADHSAPDANSQVTTTTAYKLSGLNNNQRATQYSLESNFTFDIGSALSFSSLVDTATNNGSAPGAQGVKFNIDQQEPNRFNPSTAQYIDNEIANWENSGIPGTTVNPAEQLDFGRNSSVTFNTPSGGFTDLILADLGGLNPFTLNLCPVADCSTASRIFGGFSSGLTNALLGLSDFAASDGVTGAMDQVWLFRFSETITDFVQVVEGDNRNIFFGERLQADYIGAVGVNNTSPVPGPASLPLLAGGIVLLGWARRRRSR